MNVVGEMMQSMSGTDMDMAMDASMMQQCIEACSAASMAGTMCADADMAMSGDMDMARCASMCTSMSEVAATTMRMMMRPTGMDMGAMRAMMQACMTMGEACAMECESHTDMAHCRICASACRAMVESCRQAMGAMPTA